MQKLRIEKFGFKRQNYQVALEDWFLRVWFLYIRPAWELAGRIFEILGEWAYVYEKSSDFLTFLYLNKESAGMIRAQKKRGEVAF